MSKELRERLERLKQNLAEAERTPDENKLYIEDLKASIKSVEQALKPYRLLDERGTL